MRRIRMYPHSYSSILLSDTSSSSSIVAGKPSRPGDDPIVYIAMLYIIVGIWRYNINYTREELQLRRNNIIITHRYEWRDGIAC